MFFVDRSRCIVSSYAKELDGNEIADQERNGCSRRSRHEIYRKERVTLFQTCDGVLQEEVKDSVGKITA